MSSYIRSIAAAVAQWRDGNVNAREILSLARNIRRSA